MMAKTARMTEGEIRRSQTECAMKFGRDRAKRLEAEQSALLGKVVVRVEVVGSKDQGDKISSGQLQITFNDGTRLLLPEVLGMSPYCIVSP